MVKNKKGGSSHKKMARKHVNNSLNSRNKRTRLVKEDGEMYAKIIKIEGGSNFEVLCNDGKRRLLVVRKKFKGRNKRDNSLKIDTMIMIGLRDWQVVAEKKREKVDLLEVYRESQYEELSKDKKLNLELFPLNKNTDASLNEDGFVFDNSVQLDENETKLMEDNLKLATIKEDNDSKEEEMDIDWDDI